MLLANFKLSLLFACLLAIFLFLSGILFGQDSPPGTLLASTYFGGSDNDGNFETPLAIDADGNVFVAVTTKSNDIIPPGTPGYDNDYNGGIRDVIVAKFDNNLSTLLSATYVGGSGDDGDWPGLALALDNDGNVYVAGGTNSSDLADMTGAYQPTIGGATDAFICKLDNDLNNILAVTYIGGINDEYYLQMTLDNSGNIYLCGTTASDDYPTTPGAFDETYNGGSGGPYPGDLFVSKLNSDLSTLLASTFIGGGGNDYCEGMVVGSDNGLYIAGWVSSADFPTDPASYQPGFHQGVYDGFVSKFSPDLTELTASTFLGGTAWDFCYDITLGNDGTVYTSGHTMSANFPIIPGAYDSTCTPGADNDDIFVSRLTSDLTTLLASTFLGSYGFEGAVILVVDADNNVYINGHTNSPYFPILFSAVNPEFSGGELYSGDGYVALFDEDLSILKAATYIGGSFNETLNGMKIDDLGYIYISGCTNSSDFPTTASAYDPTYNGEGSPWEPGNWGGDAILSKFTFDRFEKITDQPVVTDNGFSFGVSWADYDNDDYPDLCIANAMDVGQVNFLYHNNGEETITTFSKISGTNLATIGGSLCSRWGDYDNDGDLDVFFANPGSGTSGASNYLFDNDGEGNFTQITSGSIVNDIKTWTSASWADYDNDGYLDIFVGNHCPDPVCTGVGASLYDFDGENFTSIDLASIGIAADVEKPSPAWCDYDNDGDLDIFFAKPQQGTNSLYDNNGDGTFTEVTTGDIVADSSGGASWVDYDNDGDFDLFATYGRNTPCQLYRNDNNVFNRVTNLTIVTDSGYWSHCGWADYDNDGDQDLFVTANQYYAPQFNAFYENNGDGTFIKALIGHPSQDFESSSGAAWADYDRDGDLDLCVANVNHEHNSLYRNRGNSNNWINIKCIPANGCISPIGAKIRIKATIDGTPVWQLRQISSSSSNSSQEEVRVHFGLGDASVIDSVIVQWPLSGETIMIDVEPNQFLTITQTACGDVNIDGSVNVGDAVFLVNLIFHNGPSPNPTSIGDVNCDGGINVGDAVYMTNYIFKQDTPIPCAACP